MYMMADMAFAIVNELPAVLSVTEHGIGFEVLALGWHKLWLVLKIHVPDGHGKTIIYLPYSNAVRGIHHRRQFGFRTVLTVAGFDLSIGKSKIHFL